MPKLKSYETRTRKGAPIQVDKQIILWRERGGPIQLQASLGKVLLDERGCPINDDQVVVRAKARRGVYNPFQGD